MEALPHPSRVGLSMPTAHERRLQKVVDACSAAADSSQSWASDLKHLIRHCCHEDFRKRWTELGGTDGLLRTNDDVMAWSRLFSVLHPDWFEGATSEASLSIPVRVRWMTDALCQPLTVLLALHGETSLGDVVRVHVVGAENGQTTYTPEARRG